MPAVSSGVASLLGLGSSSSWQDRLKEGAYTSPSGTRIKYEFTDLQRQVTKRGTVFDFSGVNEGYVQRKGFGSRRYPLRCFFSGPDHDRVANAFFAALLEDGLGKLEHPTYGTFKVVPLGDITERTDLVFAANQSIIEVTFWTTLEQVYPAPLSQPQNEIEAALAGFDVVAAQEFEAQTSLTSAVNQANAKATIRAFLKEVSGALREVSDATASVRREFDDVFRLVNSGIDVLIGQPLLLAQQVANLVRAPSRAVAGIESRLDGYASFAERIFGSPAGSFASGVTSVASRQARLENDFQASNLFAMNAVAGSVSSVVNNTFSTKPEAIESAESVLDQFDDLIEWREPGFEATGQVDEGGAYQALHRSVALTAGFLVEVSFSLVPERRIVLDRDRTIVDLAAELYGSVDDRLEQLIKSNSLSGSQILELKRGDVIRYYPQPS